MTNHPLDSKYYMSMDERLARLEFLTSLSETTQTKDNTNINKVNPDMLSLTQRFQRFQSMWATLMSSAESQPMAQLAQKYKLLEKSLILEDDGLYKQLNQEILSFEGKLQLLLSCEEQIQSVAQQLQQITEMEGHVNYPELQEFVKNSTQLKSLNQGLKQHTLEYQELQLQLNFLLDAYNKTVHASSEIFIYFDQVLANVETQIRTMEKLKQED